ncbi:MAG TPA: maleylpyruvate isomerase family mycothiol-dependent enzyme [Acidimicrobiales bacterium]|jgi:uncharacterized protein (TIGR03083 family)
MPSGPPAWIAALRSSHDRLRALVAPLSPAQVGGPSYDTEWAIADVLSHLGSQAEIFDGLVDAGLAGRPAPEPDTFPAIWDRWNAKAPTDQVADSIAANERLVARLEALGPGELEHFSLDAFGQQLDVVAVARMRLSEHAVHVWDVAVALDPRTEVSQDAVRLLVDHVGDTAARTGKPLSRAAVVGVTTTDPERRFALVADGVRLEPQAGQAVSGVLELPSEALLRLVYGRLDPQHTPAVRLEAPLSLDDLRSMFPGF